MYCSIYGKKEKIEQLKQSLTLLLEPTRNEQGCISYTLHQNTENPNTFTMIERFENKEAFELQISDHVVQCALWQITDELDLDEFSRVVRAVTAESKADLQSVVEVANIILRKAKIKPTIVV